MATLSKYKGLIIGVVVLILAFVGYLVLKKPAGTETSGIDVSIVNTNPEAGMINSEDPAQALVLQLLSIQNIQFDVTFFEDPIYRELVDQSRPLGEREVGRPNPFLRIGIDSASQFNNSTSDSETGFQQTSTNSTGSSR